MAYLASPYKTSEVIKKYSFVFRKKFGQNFLISPAVLESIMDAAELNKEDTVLEIGPGIGTMTQYLAERAAGRDVKHALEETLGRALPTVLTSGVILVTAGFIIGYGAMVLLWIAADSEGLQPLLLQGVGDSPRRPAGAKDYGSIDLVEVMARKGAAEGLAVGIVTLQGAVVGDTDAVDGAYGFGG